MRVQNLPTIDAGYWVAIVAASMCGTNTGDLAAGPLGLGHIRGLVPLGLLFLVILWAERRSAVRTVAFYWLAIIMLRTMATNIADFATHDLHLSYPAFVAGLIAFMGVMVWADRSRGDPKPLQTAAPTRFPATDWRYWLLMLAAGVLGTAAGDWLAEDLGPGVYAASALGMPAFLLAVWAAYRFGLSQPWYWIAIAACRTWGTDLGDMLVSALRSVASRPVALWVSTAISAALLTVIVWFWTKRDVARTRVAAPEASG